MDNRNYLEELLAESASADQVTVNKEAIEEILSNLKALEGSVVADAGVDVKEVVIDGEAYFRDCAASGSAVYGSNQSN